ncbi:copper resistance protein B [Acinetobacter calcoaceticus]|uniref:Copper resistance protein B n=1 Tax=Acinetobacter calcoaceticus TaxID=471 RepID=A0A4R1X814_ACICA|nr:copper resistance protein B [Acinetobacter calcoaceticus]
MRIINRQLGLGLSALLLANIAAAESVGETAFDHAAHLKEHGGQIYQLTTLDAKWVRNEAGQGALQSEWESWIGSDENKVFLKGHAEKAESEEASFGISALYSRNVADYWDVQGGVRYRYDKNKPTDKARYDAVVGLYGMAPYYFETEAYLYVGQDDQLSLSIETERDILFTQKLIMQPYLQMDLLMNDESKYAKKTGLSHIAMGIETRYEISKKFMPFVDVSYQYNRGNEQTLWQDGSSSDQSWVYGAGLRVKF